MQVTRIIEGGLSGKYVGSSYGIYNKWFKVT